MDSGREHYKLILVDDEDEVRGRISSKISRESGFCVVGTAGNGYDALELIDKYRPHVVITDIRMPYIDGIELARTIKSEYPTIRVAFITGYDEFDYAREAIALGVRSYLTKPLTQNEITRFLVTLKKELDEEFRQNSDRELLQQRYEESRPLIIDNYFASVLSNSAPGAELEIRSLANHGIEFSNKKAALTLIHVGRNDEDIDIFLLEKKKLLIRKSIKDILIRRNLEFYHFLYHDEVVFIIVESGSIFFRELDEALLEAVQTAEMYHSTEIDIGVSGIFRGFDNLREAYLDARRALSDSLFLSSGRIAYIEQLETRVPRPVVMNETDTKALEYIIRFGSDEEVNAAIDNQIHKTSAWDSEFSDYRFFTLNIANMVVNFAVAVGADISIINDADIMDTINRFTTSRQTFEWFRTIVGRLRENNRQTKLSNSSVLLENAVSYMKSSFTDPNLNLEKTCDNAGLSVSYLSLLFKKHLGKTFVKYLTELRLEKAKELLKYSGDRIIEIAEKCGYSDVYYFSHNFKKHLGMSPKKYRENETVS